MRLIFVAILTLFFSSPALAEICDSEVRADKYPYWEYIINNAVRTADYYAMDRNPRATFITATSSVNYQYAGVNEGKYHINLTQRAPSGTSFIVLLAKFDMCADPAGIDDSREDLFDVVVAKFNGREF